MVTLIDNDLPPTNSWHLEINWTGTHTSLEGYEPEKFFFDKKFYLEPYFLLSFFPTQSLKWGKAFKIFPGFNQKNLLAFTKQEKKALGRLHNDDPNFNYYQWGLTINDKLKKGCTFFVKKNFKRVFSPTQSNANSIYFNDQFLAKKPFLIPWSCLVVNQKNVLKIWWEPLSKNKKEWYLPGADKIIINFFLPKLEKKNLVLFSQTPQKDYFPYLFFIKTEFKKIPQFFSFGGAQILFFSQLKEKYYFPQPFQSLWYFKYFPLLFEREKLEQIFNYFSFVFLKDEIAKWQNDNHLNDFSLVKTKITAGFAKKIVWEGKIQKFDKQLFQTSFSAKKAIFTHFVYYYLHRFLTKTRWNQEKETLVLEAPTFFASFFNNPKLIQTETSFFTNFIWNFIYPIEFFFQQKIFFDNYSFWEKPQISSISQKDKNNHLLTITLFLLLEKWDKTFFLEKWKLTHYLQWRKKWQRDFI